MTFTEQVQNKIDNKTKPLGALGDLEAIAKQLCLIQNTLSPEICEPHVVVFAGDHGIAKEGVSAYPQEVTWQMVMNFVSGGAAINVFCRQHELSLLVVDAGVNYEFPADLPILSRKIARGTHSFSTQSAMSVAQLEQALETGKKVVQGLAEAGCNLVGFGEMGIGNTASASMIMSQLTGLPLSELTGRGTGLNDQQLAHKLAILQKAQALHGQVKTPLEVLRTFGGFEIAQMVGAMQEAAKRNMLILVDGFIASAAYLIAYEMDSTIAGSVIFCHLSHEQGHQKLLDYLSVQPLLGMNLRLGEGSGCALAFPLIKSAALFMNEMASFTDAGVSKA